MADSIITQSNMNIQKEPSFNNSHFGIFSLIASKIGLAIGSTISSIVCCICCDIHEGIEAMVKTLHINPTVIKKVQLMRMNNRLHFDLAPMVSKRKIEYLKKNVTFNSIKNCA